MFDADVMTENLLLLATNPERLERAISAALRAAYAAGLEQAAQIAEAPFGPGLSDRDDYWQPRIAYAIRLLIPTRTTPPPSSENEIPHT